MRRISVATTMLLLLTATAGAWQGHPRTEARSCLVEVLYSEELPIGPLLHHTVKATLLVTASNKPPFETTVEKVIPWQVPPLRRGQQLRVGCDSVRPNSSFGLF